jgi:hypothetical protein
MRYIARQCATLRKEEAVDGAAIGSRLASPTTVFAS